jgi:adenylate cyclase
MAIDHFDDAEQRELWQFLDERISPDADVEDVDRRIWEKFGTAGAIMFTDLSGFTRRSAELGITHFLQIIHQSQILLRPVIEQRDGTIFEVVGDSMLLWFPTIQQALQCSIEMQQACRQFNAGLEPAHQILLCLGIGYGRVIRIGDSRLAGEEVNVASKLGEDIAEGYEILISDEACKAAGEMPSLTFTLTGMHLPGSPEVYRVTAPDAD